MHFATVPLDQLASSAQILLVEEAVSDGLRSAKDRKIKQFRAEAEPPQIRNPALLRWSFVFGADRRNQDRGRTMPRIAGRLSRVGANS
jgi:hypothetical protein